MTDYVSKEELELTKNLTLDAKKAEVFFWNLAKELPVSDSAFDRYKNSHEILMMMNASCDDVFNRMKKS